MYTEKDTASSNGSQVNEQTIGKLEQALSYAAQGLAIFPVYGVNPDGSCQCKGKPSCNDGENTGKHPITAKGLTEATTDTATVTNWWTSFPDANIGVATGKVSGIVVLDIDGKTGRDSLNGSELPNGYRVTTGREDGGEHRYFAYFPVKNSAGKLGKGLDIRGDGGYVIAAGSRHRSGTLYQSIGDLNNLPEMPECLKDKLNQADSRPADPLPGKKMTAGGRNTWLTRVAGRYRRDQASKTEMLAALRVRNAERCDPPLPDEELTKIVESIGSKPIGDELTFDDQSEEGYAKRLALFHFGEIRYINQLQRWMVWNPDLGVWEIDGKDNIKIKQRTLEMLEATYKAADTITDSTPERQLRRQHEFRDAVMKKRNHHAVTGIIALAAALDGIAVDPDELDANPWLFNVRNGTLNLRTGTLQESNPDDLITKLAGTAHDERATAPTWERFVSDILPDPELRAYVQRALGYMLTGDMAEQDFWIAHGTGANGKSTLLNTMLRVLGEHERGYGSTTSFTTFDAEKKDDKTSSDLAALKGRRGVMAIEAEKERSLAESRVKTITGGDSISCRFLYGDPFTYRPTYKVWLAVNHKPNIRGVDRGIWRRIKLVPFTENFEGREDKTLDTTLRLELPGILNWLLAGLYQWQQIGMSEPEAVKVATEEYREESDVIGQWLEERCELDPTYSAMSGSLFADYAEWMKERNEERFAGSTKAFGVLLGERGFANKQGTKGSEKGKRKYHGLRLRPLNLSESRGN